MKRPRQTRQDRKTRFEEASAPWEPMPQKRRVVADLKPMTENQALYMNLINANTLTFGLGPAGTGKTFIAAWLAGLAFSRGDCFKLIITRPIVEAGESIGFLPGEMEEKIDPYFAPVREALERCLGKGPFDYMIKSKQIEFVPLAFMRGRTFQNAWVIADEMQNSTPKQMKMLLTRIGMDTKIIVNGDLRQSDIPGENGLADAVERLAYKKHIATLVFTRDDVVRSGLARVIVDAYEGEDDQPLPAFLLRSPTPVDDEDA